MSVLSYLKRAFPSVEPPAVVDALLTPERVTFCEDGRFIAIRLEGNKQIKIPSDMGKGCPVNLADRILLEWGIQIGGSWAKTHAYKGPQHKRVAERFLNRLSPPPVLEQLFTVRLQLTPTHASTDLNLDFRSFVTGIDQDLGFAIAHVGVANNYYPRF